MQRRKREQPIGMGAQTLGKESILQRTGGRLGPVPPLQDGTVDPCSIHFTQQSVDRRKSLHRTAVPPDASGQGCPRRLALSDGPASGVGVGGGRIKVHVSVDPNHAAAKKGVFAVHGEMGHDYDGQAGHS
jgi:hypothetical protein